VTDGLTDGQNYDSQDRASIAASRGKINATKKFNAGAIIASAKATPCSKCLKRIDR